MTTQEPPQDQFHFGTANGLVVATSTSAGWVATPFGGSNELVFSSYFDDGSGNPELLVATADETSTIPSWNMCAFTAQCLQAGLPCCGPSSNDFRVPMFTDPIDPGHSQVKWGGDPYLVTTRNGLGPAGLVLVVSLGVSQDSNSGSGHTDLVVATESWDGGKTFVRTDLVNDGHCNSGAMQMPAAYLDVNTGALWVVWRYDNFPDSGGTYGACIRRGDVEPASQTIHWGTVFDIQNLNRQPFTGVGGLLVDGTDTHVPATVTVVYSNTDHTYTCPDGDNKDVAWYEVATSDDGQSWTPSTLVYDTQGFTWCPAGGQIQNSLRAFGYMKTNIDGMLVQWAALNVARNTIELWRKNGTTPGTAWTLWDVFTDSFTDSRFFPSLASDGSNHLALEFMAADGLDQNVGPEYIGTTHVLQNAWDPTFTLQPTTPIRAGALNLGKYVSLASRPISGAPTSWTYLATYPEFEFPAGTGPFVVSDRVGTQ